MSVATRISWTDHTFNPWIGCTKVSEGCRNCYAEQFAKQRMRLDVWGLSKDRHRTKTWGDVPRWNRKAMLDRERKRVFCASLADVFEDHAQANEIRPRLWDLVRQSTWLDWLILTKRPENISSMLPPDWGQGWRNVWLGVTVEDDRVAGRLDELRSVPSLIRFVSYEPALGPLDHCDFSGIDWVIYGGESGPNYRQDDPRWARAMHSKCQDEGIAFFFKQSSGRVSGRGIELDGQITQQVPAVKEVQA